MEQFMVNRIYLLFHKLQNHCSQLALQQWDSEPVWFSALRYVNLNMSASTEYIE